MTARGLAAAALAVGALAGGGVAPAHAEEDACESVGLDDPTAVNDQLSSVAAQLSVEAAHRYVRRLGREPGEGVTVAVVDSGVASSRFLDQVEGRVFSEQARELSSEHGSVVAGLIAADERPEDDGGVAGIAPAARIFDVQVYDVFADPAEDQSALSAESLAAGLDHVTARVDELGIGVVAVPVWTEESAEVTGALRRLAARDVVIVTAAGNRPTSELEPLFEVFGRTSEDPIPNGEDARGLVWPAAAPEPNVLAVTATADGTEGEVDIRTSVLPNSDVDLAAPTVGGIGLSINGGYCALTPDDVDSTYAVGVVAGVAALVRSAHPDEPQADIVSRLLQSATGVVGPDPGRGARLTGDGLVQPAEAVSLPVENIGGTVSGIVDVEQATPRAEPPPLEADPLAEPRRDAVWWGLVGGGLLVIALVLRPVLARRR